LVLLRAAVLTRWVLQIYKTITAALGADSKKWDPNMGKNNALRAITLLKKLCNHPLLLHQIYEAQLLYDIWSGKG
jgi:SNF2 family DNA or RNA helicase